MTSTRPRKTDPVAVCAARGVDLDLARDALFRLLVSLIAEHLGRARKRAVDPAEWTRWDLKTTIDEDGIGVDSLGRLDLIARVNEFFHMYEVGSEDYLVVRRTLGDWVEIVEATLERKFKSLTFQTSGSTGEPKKVRHSVARLVEEIEAFGAVFERPTRIIACPPAHHVYGFLFTILAPRLWGAEVLDARAAAPSVLRRATSGDLVVATPFHWDLLMRGLGGARAPAGVRGVVSGAPTPPELWRAIETAGVERLVEIYGSTETAGVGWRDAADAPFRLLPIWRRLSAAEDPNDLLVRTRPPEDLAPTPDQLSWRSEDEFRPVGRRDGAVQIGGVNVFPAKVRARIEELDVVAECAVRKTDDHADARLKAFVVLADPLTEALATEALEAHCRARLAAAERPIAFTFGAALPRNEMGKLRDWS